MFAVFCGWRPKVGGALLLLSCALLLAWMRSIAIGDEVCYSFSDDYSLWLISRSGSITLLWAHHMSPHFGLVFEWKRYSVPIKDPGYVGTLRPIWREDSRWSFLGIDGGSMYYELTPTEISYWTIPYWIMMLLSMLPATYFMFCKPPLGNRAIEEAKS